MKVGIVKRLRFGLAAVLAFAALPGNGAATGLDSKPWVLDAAGSTLTYQSVKKNTIVETNRLQNLRGTVTPAGAATVTVDLNSVDSGIDVRDVRMRFLLFQTFKFPVATIYSKIDPAALAELPAKRRIKIPLTFSLDLHGFQKTLTAPVVVTLVSDTQVSVASERPIEIKVEDFGLLPGIEKLEHAGDVVNIVPVASVSFDFLFTAESAAAPTQVIAEPMKTDAAKASFSNEECLNRFEALSRSGAIYFADGSYELDPASKLLLNAAREAIFKCPTFRVEISGHTDSNGSFLENLRLSKFRAEAVAAYLRAQGIAAERLQAVGYGPARPVAPNNSDKNRALNRRIEFRAEAPK